MSTIRVLVNGATGRMGVETVGAVCRQDDMTLVGAACRRNRGPALSLPGGGEAPLSTKLGELVQQTKPDVLVDFTNAAASMEAALVGAAHSVNMVVGASGLTGDDLKQLEGLARDNNIGVIVAPNFALGAVVLKRLAERAAQFFEYVDIVEAHHEMKIDSPSGFAMDLARTIGDQKQFDPQLPGEGEPVQHKGRRIQRRDGAQHQDAGTERPSRGYFWRSGADGFPASRHPKPGLLYAGSFAVHQRGCEASGSRGRLGKCHRFVGKRC